MILTVRIEKHDEKLLEGFVKKNKLNRTQAVKDLLNKGFMVSQLQDFQEGKISLGRLAEQYELSIIEALELVSGYNAHPEVPRDYISDARIHADALQ